MKIGVYTPEYPSITSVGGVGTYTRNLGRALASLGHCVHVLTPGTPQRVCNDGPVSVHVAAADHFPIIERFFPGSGSFYRIGKAMQRLAVQQQLDVVEFANWEGMGVWFSMRRSIPMVVRLHTSSLEAHSLRGRAFSRPVKWDVRRERWQALRADALVTHSEAHRREMANELGIDKDRIALVPHGVPVYPDFQRVEARKEEFSVVSLGRLEIRKGTLDLLHAIPQVLSAVPKTRFTFIGKDRADCPHNRTHAQYLRDEFPAEIRSRIDLLGPIPDDAVNRCLQNADLFVAPSLYESFGLVFLEAMRWGTPVIGTRAGAIPEIVEHGKTGLLAAPHSPGELAEAMITLLKDSARRRGLGEAGRRRVETHFSVARMARQVDSLYRDVVHQWRSRRSPGQLRKHGPRPRQSVHRAFLGGTHCGADGPNT
ncbi:MAG: glycosyltransferase family 4 protein [Thermoguttaceae bacterium]